MRARPGLLLILGLGLVVFAVVTTLQMRMAPVTPPTEAQVPIVSVADASQTLKAGQRLGAEAMASLQQQADAGDAEAMNVLGVALRRTKATRDQAQALFERAAAAGSIGARYNLAVILPDKFKTDPAIVQRRLDLLQANVALGDIPSVVELANSLFYVNRDAFVPDRADRRRALYAQAATTGDADYQLIYGKSLWAEIRGGADPSLINPALIALNAAYKAGDPRGAETIGSILQGCTGGVIAAISDDFTERDPLVWYRRAADMGLPTARCAFGFEMFDTGTWVRTADMSLIERHFRAGPAILGNAPQDVTHAMGELEYCATRPKRARRPNPPFGEATLYLFKQRGTYTSISNQPGWANMTLGILHGYGIGVPRNRSLALDYLQIAATRENFEIAAQIIEVLPDFDDQAPLPEPE